MTMVLSVNGMEVVISSAPDTPLAYVLRNELGLKGTKIGCALEQCGACAVLADGHPVYSCVSPVSTFEGRNIVTIEAIDATDTGRRVQEAFVHESAAHCGYCTAGLIIATMALLNNNPKPQSSEIKCALRPHLCRCGSHPRVIRAVAKAAQR